jgi:hypothetical protein
VSVVPTLAPAKAPAKPAVAKPAVAKPAVAKPAKPAKPAVKPKVKVRIVPMLGKGELQIGKTVHVVGTASYDLMLPVGKHAVKWRAQGGVAWTDRPALVLSTGYDYLLHVAPTATKLTPKPKETP